MMTARATHHDCHVRIHGESCRRLHAEFYASPLISSQGFRCEHRAVLFFNSVQRYVQKKAANVAVHGNRCSSRPCCSCFCLHVSPLPFFFNYSNEADSEQNAFHKRWGGGRGSKAMEHNLELLSVCRLHFPSLRTTKDGIK